MFSDDDDDRKGRGIEQRIFTPEELAERRKRAQDNMIRVRPGVAARLTCLRLTRAVLSFCFLSRRQANRNRYKPIAVDGVNVIGAKRTNATLLDFWLKDIHKVRTFENVVFVSVGYESRLLGNDGWRADCSVAGGTQSNESHRMLSAAWRADSAVQCSARQAFD